MPCDDRELLRRYAVDQSTDAFAELVQRHIGLVYSIALRQVRGDAALAHDVVQTVFTVLARKARTVAQSPAMGGWLYRTTQFTAIDMIRSEARRRAREQKAHALFAEDTAGDAAGINWERLRPLLDRLIADLGARDRDAIVLRFFETRSFADIGARLAVPENTARMRVERALAKLRSALARNGVSSTGAALALALAEQPAVAVPSGLALSVTGVALSEGAAAGGLATVVLHFMSTSKIVFASVTFAALAAVGTEMYRTRMDRAAMTALQAERDQWKGIAAAASQRASRAEAALAAAEATNRATADVVTPTVTTLPAPTWTHTDRVEYVLDHPEARAAYLERAALTFKTRFERFFQSAGLSGEQQDQFVRIALDDAEGRLDALAARRAIGGLGMAAAANNPMVAAKLDAEEAERDTAVAAKWRQLLGPQFKPAMDYLNGIAERNVADQLASALYYTETPLTAAQADGLTQVLRQNRFHAASSSTASNTIGGTFIPPVLAPGNISTMPLEQVAMPWMYVAPVTDAALAHAGEVLSGPQLAALKVLQAQQAADLQLRPPAISHDRAPGSPK